MRSARTALAFVHEVGVCSTFYAFGDVGCLWESVAGRAAPRWPKHSHHDAAVGLTEVHGWPGRFIVHASGVSGRRRPGW